jgi:hypothetical protein
MNKKFWECRMFKQYLTMSPIDLYKSLGTDTRVCSSTTSAKELICKNKVYHIVNFLGNINRIRAFHG